jgi:membrane-associated HD superfamily phosphohydrolase
MRLALRMEEMPYPAVTSTRKPARIIMIGDVVEASSTF